MDIGAYSSKGGWPAGISGFARYSSPMLPPSDGADKERRTDANVRSVRQCTPMYATAHREAEAHHGAIDARAHSRTVINITHQGWEDAIANLQKEVAELRSCSCAPFHFFAEHVVVSYPLPP